MLFDQQYKVVNQNSEAIFRDKGSKFIAYARAVSNIDDFKKFLVEIKNEHPSARHFCYAYRIGYDKSVFRSNDDGEPSGSAGKPIYNQLLAYDLTNTAVIVVRYFGGTLLGVPGLINAYKQSTVEAINNNIIIEKDITEKAQWIFGYDKMNAIMKLIKDHQLKILHQDADEENYLYQLEIPLSISNMIKEKFDKIQNVNWKYIETY